MKIGDLAEYADRRLQAAELGRPLPEPPEILADVVTLRVSLFGSIVLDVIILAIIGIAVKLAPGELFRALGLRRFDWDSVWRPFLVMLGAYAFVAAYAALMEALNAGILEPESTIPFAVLRDDMALALAVGLAVIAAPVTEEVFFRGFLFGGLTKWGFWPGALISSGLFSLAHLDPGSVIPFFGVGLLMAWLFWRRGALIDSLMFHLFFNLMSTIFLVSSR